MAALWLAIALLQSALPAPVDMTRLLDEMADRASIARLSESGWSARSSGSPQTPVTDFLVLTVDGPGAITCIATDTARGRVSIWIDEDAPPDAPGVAREPTLVVDWNALLAAKPPGASLVWASEAGGASFHVPIPFSRRASVKVDGIGCRVDWRRYEDLSRVTSFARGDLERHRSAIERVDRAWRAHAAPAGEDTFTFSLSGTNPEGELLGIGSSPTAGPRAVSEIRLRVDGADVSQGLRHCTLRLTFDGEETVAVPLGAFFGSQDEMSARSSWFVAMEPPGDLVARWVMPYRERMTMRIDNAGDSDLHVAGIVRTIPWTWDERSLHFHAAWRAVDPSRPLVITGQGHYVGELVSIAAPDDQAPGEAGTAVSAGGGVADWNAIELAAGPTFATALRGVALCSAPGRWDAYRFRVLDAVPFATSLRHRRHGNTGSSAQRASCIVYYARPGAKTDAPALPRDPAEVLPAPRKR